ncbi:MAG: hypothetical protein GX219_07935 [Tissierellia bacterium]|nr:hypothetical protein [Tissierellia bacterium]
MRYYNNLEVDELLKELKEINSELLHSTKNNAIKASVLWPLKIRDITEKDEDGFSSLKEYTIETCKLLQELSFNHPRDLTEIALGLRRRLRKDLDVLEAYEVYLLDIIQYINNFAVEVFAKESFDNASVSIDLNWLKTRIFTTLNSLSKDPVRYFNLVRQIIAELPMRVTKDKLNEIIAKSLLKNLEGRPEFYADIPINLIKMEVGFKKVQGFGTIFKEVYQLIEKIAKDSYEGRSSDSLKVSIGVGERILSKIRFYIVRFKEMGLAINQLITYSLITGYELDESTVKLLDNFKNLSEDKLPKHIERLERSLKEDQKYQNNKVDSFNQVNRALILGKEFNPEEIIDLLNNTKNTLVYYNDSNFFKEEDLKKEMIVPLRPDEIVGKINDLIGFINENIEAFEGPWRKIVLRSALTRLEVPFVNIDEFLNFVDHSLSDKSVPKRVIHSKTLIIDNILRRAVGQ